MEQLFVIGIWHLISITTHYIVTPKGGLSRTRNCYYYATLLAIIPILLLLDASLTDKNIPHAFLKALLPSPMAFF